MNKRGGFTIVELLIVIVVIAILATITVVAFNSVQAKARFSSNQDGLTKLNRLVLTFHAQNGVYPGNTTYTGSSGNFIPGLVPTFAASLPAITDTGNNDYWAYITDSNGANYKLIRLVGGANTLPSVESTGNNKIDPSRPTRGWGYWSSGGSGY